MVLKISRSGKTIAKEVVLCRSSISQMRGLMFARDNRERALIMVFSEERIVPLHMLFVFFPIDILFLDSKKKVVEVFKGAKPFISYIRPKHKAKYVIELSAGAAKAGNIRAGEKLVF